MLFEPATCSPTIDAANPNAEFTFEPVPNGRRANMGHTSGTTDATPSLPDVNGDNFIDGIDVLHIALSFASMNGDSHYAELADVNQDNAVDGLDLTEVSKEFGTGCD